MDSCNNHAGQQEKQPTQCQVESQDKETHVNRDNDPSERPRKKRRSVDLIEEWPNMEIFSTKRIYGGRTYESFKFVLKKEPQFTLERSNDIRNSEFIKTTYDNKLVGLMRNGELEYSDKVEKLFFLNKLNLKPSNCNRQFDALKGQAEVVLSSNLNELHNNDNNSGHSILPPDILIYNEPYTPQASPDPDQQAAVQLLDDEPIILNGGTKITEEHDSILDDLLSTSCMDRILISQYPVGLSRSLWAQPLINNKNNEA